MNKLYSLSRLADLHKNKNGRNWRLDCQILQVSNKCAYSQEVHCITNMREPIRYYNGIVLVFQCQN